MKRRSLFVVVLVVGPSAAIGACSIDSLTFAPGDDGGGIDGPSANETSTADGGVDTGTDDAAEEFVVLVDGSDPDALIVKDSGGTQILDSSACTATTCDCDKDTYENHGLAACAADPGDNDCNDTDSRVHPGQGFLEDKPGPGEDGNWNCVNGVETLYPTNINCGLLNLGQCSGTQGFSDNPGCGDEGTYIFCAPTLALLCGVGSMQTRKQACK